MTNVVNLAEYRAWKKHHEYLAGEGICIPSAMYEEAPSYLRQGIPLDAFTTPLTRSPSVFTVFNPTHGGSWLASAWTGAQPPHFDFSEVGSPDTWTEKDDDK